ncbi:30S ribosomal protein S17 [Candidatus Kaiserbacteria bacterium RIFCSPHIGHO2_02_FULL_49_11]|uniref:Small ribosomal subunit protein uS17 n=1 Tax=Candidatus Kaiserbacteria bacterium RIFCSPHIGHO2_02_FULL_49_11 TaxID=1798489 RepID=A0A1F6CZJ0_9BACT|nr:MAG: 30S ribosomal protein S17 [Candidatus Kaiserbacteria bacterium RIFCSPHIGHO2_02_FULL_49_11]
MEKESQQKGKVLHGVVVSNKMKDTIVIEVAEYRQHPKYKKYFRRTKKYLAHDEGNTKQIGEKVSIRETRPLSKRKSFVVIS